MWRMPTVKRLKKFRFIQGGRRRRRRRGKGNENGGKSIGMNQNKRKSFRFLWKLKVKTWRELCKCALPAVTSSDRINTSPSKEECLKLCNRRWWWMWWMSSVTSRRVNVELAAFDREKRNRSTSTSLCHFPPLNGQHSDLLFFLHKIPIHFQFNQFHPILFHPFIFILYIIKIHFH